MAKAQFLVHYIRDNNLILYNDKGRYIQSKGRRRGVLVSTKAGYIGWSLWNEKAEYEENFNNYLNFWINNGMDPYKAREKAHKKAYQFTKFDREVAIHLAFNREEFFLLSSLQTNQYIPFSIHDLAMVMVERSWRYFAKENIDMSPYMRSHGVIGECKTNV